jgi:hypothetical protein
MKKRFPHDARTILKRTVLRFPSIGVDEIGKVLAKRNLHLSSYAVAHYRLQFRSDLRLLEREGVLVGLDWEKSAPLSSRGKRNVRASRVAKGLSSQRQTIIHAIANANKPIGPNAIVNATGMRSANVRYLLHVMVKNGDVTRMGHGRYRVNEQP